VDPRKSSLFQRISKYAVGVVLLQKDEQGHLQPCAYYSKVFQSNQTHYPAYQQELLGIVLAIQEWRHYIEAGIVLQVDKDFIHKIVSSYPLDPTYAGTTIPRGTDLNDHDGLYYFGDKVYIPKDAAIINSLIQEAHDSQGHPSAERTLANFSKTFWWPRMRKTVIITQSILQLSSPLLKHYMALTLFHHLT
jgi:hypothetical protein